MTGIRILLHVVAAALIQKGKLDIGMMVIYNRGGRLKFFMIYDMIIATLCSFGIAYWMLVLRSDDIYQQHEIIYYFKMLYGLLSFPFLIFLIPGFNILLVKSRETGYDK